MTALPPETLSPETACAILASHGADPARWPAEQRAALLALAGDDPVVAAALADARALDALLNEWAATPAPLAGIDAAAIVARPQLPAPQAAGLRPSGSAGLRSSGSAGLRRGLVAASVAIVAAIGGWLGVQPAGPSSTEIATAAPPSAAAAAGEADLAFAFVFTPTAAEEDLI